MVSYQRVLVRGEQAVYTDPHIGGRAQRHRPYQAGNLLWALVVRTRGYLSEENRLCILTPTLVGRHSTTDPIRHGACGGLWWFVPWGTCQRERAWRVDSGVWMMHKHEHPLVTPGVCRKPVHPSSLEGSSTAASVGLVGHLGPCWSDCSLLGAASAEGGVREG